MAFVRPVSHATRSVAERAVHIKVFPATRSVRESREILRVLKEFGEVAMFRNLRYDHHDPAPHTILAVYQKPEAASKLIAASPFSFAIESPSTTTEDNVSPESVALSTVDRPLGDVGNAAPPPPREFQLTVEVSLTDHEAKFQRSHYFWGFGSPPQTFVEEDLASSVPTAGMSYLNGGSNPLPSRIVSKKLDEVARRKSLRQIWKEGQREDRLTERTSHSRDQLRGSRLHK